MKNKNHLFPTIIVLASLQLIYRLMFQAFDVYSLLSLIVGATGIALYYKGHAKYDSFFYAWLYMQFPYIYMLSPDGSIINIADAFALLHIQLGLSLTVVGGKALGIYLNAIPIGLYFILKYVNAEKPVGTRLAIGRLRKDSFAQTNLPVYGLVQRITGRQKLDAIYQIELDNEITIRDKSYRYILLESKDNAMLKLDSKQGVCALRLCETPNVPFNDVQSPMIDWVTVTKL